MQSRTVWFAVPVQLTVKVEEESAAAPLRIATFPYAPLPVPIEQDCAHAVPTPNPFEPDSTIAKAIHATIGAFRTGAGSISIEALSGRCAVSVTSYFTIGIAGQLRYNKLCSTRIRKAISPARSEPTG
jgi:hypothetical protein